MINKFMREKQDKNLEWQPPKPRVEKLTGGGLFQDYEYMPDDYNNFMQKKRDDRIESKFKQEKISKKPFTLGMDPKVWKYKDCFLPPEQQADYVLPYFVSDDPYEATEDQIMQAKWIHENKILNGDFRPAQADKSLERLTPG